MRINHLSAIFALFLCVVSFSSCNKDATSGKPDAGKTDSGKSGSFTLKPGVIYFDESNTTYISVEDEESFVLSPDTPAAFSPAVGDIVLAAVGQSAPYGFMGKVLSVNNGTEGREYKTEMVALEEVFEELYIDDSIDVADQMDYLVNEEGNPVECRDVDSSVWEELGYTDEEETKASFVAEQSQIKSIPLSYPYLSGELLLATNLKVLVDISKGKVNNYDISLKTTVTIDGNLNIEGAHSLVDIPSKTLRMPGVITVGPIVLRPALVYGLGVSVDGSVKMNGPLSVGLLSATTTMKNFETPKTVFDNSHPFKTSATYLDCDGGFTIEGRVGFQFGVFSQKVLAFGVDMEPEISVELSGKMDMADKRIMAKDIVATLSGSFGSLGAYIYSALFSKHRGDKLRVAIQTPEFSYEIPLFNKGENHSCVKKVGNWGISGSFKDKSAVMEVDEAGYALFKIGKEDPIEIYSVPAGSGSTKADIGDAVFAIPDNPFDYYVRTLNTVVDSGKEYSFYGPIVGPLISSLNMDMPYYERSMSFSFQYDDYGRCQKVTRTDDGIFYYTINYVYKGETIEATWSDGGFEEITVDSKGRLISCVGTDNFDAYRNRQVSYNGNNVIISIQTDTYEGKRSLFYNNGDLVKQVINEGESYSYSYTDYPNNYSIDFTHYLLDDMGGSLTLPPFLAFPGISNSHLLKSPLPSWIYAYSDAPGISYDFDEYGRMTRLSSLPHVDIQFTYEDTKR